jgi:hypothetical protein
VDAKVKEGKTVDFRQHRGTLDWEETRNWLLLCAGFVKLARVMDEDVLDVLLNVWIEVPQEEE